MFFFNYLKFSAAIWFSFSSITKLFIFFLIRTFLFFIIHHIQIFKSLSLVIFFRVELSTSHILPFKLLSISNIFRKYCKDLEAFKLIHLISNHKNFFTKWTPTLTQKWTPTLRTFKIFSMFLKRQIRWFFYSNNFPVEEAKFSSLSYWIGNLVL